MLLHSRRHWSHIIPPGIKMIRQNRGKSCWTSQQLVQKSREHITEMNPRLNALISVGDWDQIQQLAIESDERRRKGVEQSPLDGVPVIIKDNFCTKTLPTTCASKALKDFRPPYDATVVDLLVNRAGAILIGKSNMDEFGMGSFNQHSYYGPCWNAHVDRKGERRVAGGSSGGSAVSVAAGFCSIALGSDTGGSVRLPAAYNGVIGFKPSYGRLSRHGLISYAPSLDTVGIFGDTVNAVTSVFDVLDQFDDRDPTSQHHRVSKERHQLQEHHDGRPLKGLKIGVPREYFPSELFSTTGSCVHLVMEMAAKRMEELGAEVRIVSLPNIGRALPCYYILATAEASSELARYDGVRYGHRSNRDPVFTADASDSLSTSELKSVSDVFAMSRTEGFGQEVRRRIEMGTFVLSAAHYSAYYRKAQMTRKLIEMDFRNVFRTRHSLYSNDMHDPDGVDFIMTPVSTGSAPSSDTHQSAVDEYLNDVFTIPSSLSGLPSIALPLPNLSDPSSGLPLAVQLIAQHGHDQSLLKISKHFVETE